jgi:hypothetical protein
VDSGRWCGHGLGIGREQVLPTERLVEPEGHVDTGTKRLKVATATTTRETHDDGLLDRSVGVGEIAPLHQPAGS